MGAFEDSYAQLNPAQKKAVDKIDGPVLVVAGPGTGKTQLLSMRVANILRKTDTDPSSILCLTFTNKAAINMRERLLSLTGGEAKGVMVKTFHSFAAELMNIYPDYFWNGARLTTAPDTTQIEIIQDILSKLPLSSPLALKFAGNFTAGRDVKNALKYVKEAGLTPDKIKSLINANLAYLDLVEPEIVDILSAPLRAKSLFEIQDKIHQLPDQGIGNTLQPLQDLGLVIKESLDFAITQDSETGKTKFTGKWKQNLVQTIDGKKGLHKERERNNWWLQLAGVYQSYRSSLHGRGYYDYSDMIVEVITQLQNNSSMRADVQERFLYVLIDEFQDTNAAQLQLAHIIADHQDDNQVPNLMVVGDDDQSIYKFNGAELNNMLSFQKSYPTTELIVLTENYRSSQEILDTSTTIIEQVSDRLVTRMPDLSKQLIAKNQPKEVGEIIHYSYPTEEHQFSDIARQIAKQHSDGNHDIAVLARDHSSLRKLAAILVSLEIPVRYEKQNNILENTAVVIIHNINSLLVAINSGDQENVNNLISKLLRYPMWKLEPEKLWDIAVANQRGKRWLDYMLKSADQELASIAGWLVWLAKVSSQEPLAVTLEYVIGLRAGENLTSPLRANLLDSTGKPADILYLETLSAVRILTSLANDFARGPQATLSDFVNFMQLSMDNGEVIADESVFVNGENTVELLTVHKAKGLEYDSVYVINAIDSSWRPSIGGRKCPINLPLQPVGDDTDDYVRLMYVAATRAKRSLIASSYTHDSASKDVMSTPILISAMPPKSKTSELDPIVILEENISWPRLNNQNEKQNLSEVLNQFSLSASSFLDFLDVSRGGPSYFFERHLLRLPQARTSSMAFGTAIHAALEYAQILVNSSGLIEKNVIEHFKNSLEGQYLPSHEQQRMYAHGADLISKLLKSETFWLGKGDLAEQNLSDVLIGNARIKGVIDRINVKGQDLTIIDYKTGKPLASFYTKDQNKAIKAWRHKTQLIYYALLVRNSNRFKTSKISGQMWYVEASAAKELIREYIPTEEDLSKMSNLIEIIWPKVMDLNLPDITNYSADFNGIQNFEQDLLDGKI